MELPNSRGIYPNVVTKDGDSGAKYSANDILPVWAGATTISTAVFPRSGNKSSLSGKVTVPIETTATIKLTLDTTEISPS